MDGATPEDIGRRMDGLGLWDAAAACNWGVKPRGVAFPYFCSFVRGDGRPVKARFLMLDGWQTFHDYMRFGLDRDFGFYSTPSEMPHFELVVTADGAAHVFRHDPGYVPRRLDGDAERALVAKVLWESYGVMLRLESAPGLAMAYAADKAMFGRVERDGAWADAPLPIPDPRPHVEKVTFRKDVVARAKDLPLDASRAVELDFRLLPNVVTREPRPRSAYQLAAVDPATGEVVMRERVSVGPEFGLRAMWESVPPRVLANFVRAGRVPGEIRVLTARVFRLMRPLCLELPVKLSLHDALPALARAFA